MTNPYDALRQAREALIYRSDTLARDAVAAIDAALEAQPEPTKLWLWKNFVGGRPEYWAFDNPFPVHMDSADPQTLGEPCGYALVKPSRNGRPGVSEQEVLRRIAASAPPQRQP